MKVTRVFFLFFLALASLLYAGGNQNSGATDGKVDLRLSFWFGAADMPAWQQGIDEYVQAHPNVRIIPESTPWSDYWTKLKSQVAADAQADLVGMVSMQSNYFIRNRALLDLAPYIKKENFDIGDFWPAIMSAYELNDGIYCLPYDLSTELLLCNVDMFEAAGVEFKPDGYTMDEFIQISKKLTNANQYASDFYYAEGWTLYDYLLDGGANPLDTQGNIDLNKPDIIRLIQWLADLNLVHGTNIRYDRAGRDAAAFFLAKRVAMYPVNPEWVLKIKDAMPGVKLDVMQHPFKGISNRKKTLVGGSFAVSSKTRYPDICWDFLKNYTNADKLGRIIGGTHRGIPGRRSAAPTMLTSKYAVPHSQYFFDVLDRSVYIDYPRMAECEVELNSILDRIYIGEITARKGMEDFMKAVKDIQQD
jgi:ABC-type glycerol-3-phosphate transport system substrate-binding protein